MIKHLDQYILEATPSKRILKSAQQIKSVLNRPIAKQALNIVGTSHPYNGVQLYGWKSPIPLHKDKTGFILFMPIEITGADALIYQEQQIELQVGNLYLLDDRKPHGTLGSGNVISLFMGSYQEAELTDELYKEVFNQFCRYVQ
ncbi:hypothetical protein [Acinetobacter sp. ANC 5502]